MKKIKYLIGTAIFISLICGNNAFATVTTLDKCNLAVYPYNPSASELLGNQGTPHLNYLDLNTCKQHLSYPYGVPNPDLDQHNILDQFKYLPQAPDYNSNPVKSGSENNKVPWAQHEHAFFNYSKHTDPLPQGPAYYKALVDKFQIIVMPDGWDNIDRNNLQCNTMVPYDYTGDASDLADCDGFASDLFGGTKVSKVYDNTNKVIIVTWEFAVNAPHSGRPRLWGDNGSAFKSYDVNGNVLDTTNTTDPQNRKLEFHVQMYSKNNPQQIWSTTTISRVLLLQQGILKTHYPQNFSKGCVNNDIADPNSGWCYLPATAGYKTVSVATASGTFNYFWFPIGSVSSIWKKPPPPPVTCSTLSLLIKQNGQAIQQENVKANTPMTLTVTPTYQPTNQSRPLYYIWKAGTGGIMGSTFYPQGTFNGTAQTSNGYKTTANTVTYSGGSKIYVAVQAYYDDNSIASPCYKIFFIPEQPEATCASLKIVSSNPAAMTTTQNGAKVIPPNTATTFNVLPTFSGSGVTPDLNYTWAASALTTTMPLTIPNPGIQNNNGIQLQQNTLSNMGFNAIWLAAANSTQNPANTNNANYNIGNTNTAVIGNNYTTPVYGGYLGNYINSLAWGQFKDNINDSNDNLANPYDDITKNCTLWWCTEDREVYYTGGKPGTLITVNAFKAGTDPAQYYPACHDSVIIPYEENSCVGLAISPDKLEPNKDVTFTVTPKYKDPNKPFKLNYFWEATSQQKSGTGKTAPGLGDLLQTGGLGLQYYGNIGQLGQTGSSGTNTGTGTIYAPVNPGVYGNGPQIPQQTQYVTTPPLEITQPHPNPVNQLNTNNVSTFGGNNIFGSDLIALAGNSTVPQTGLNINYTAPAIGGTGVQSAAKSGTTINVGNFNANIFALLNLGLFSDFKGSTSPTPDNPFLETKNNQTYYSGGSAGTWVSVIGQDEHGNAFPDCKAQLQIPQLPSKECKIITPVFTDNADKKTVTKEQLKAGSTYIISIDSNNSTYTDSSKLEKYAISIVNQSGHGNLDASPTNAATCPKVIQFMNLPSTAAWTGPALVTCQYLYTPKANDTMSIAAILSDGSVGTGPCAVTVTIPPETTNKVCVDNKFNFTVTPIYPKTLPLRTGDPAFLHASGQYSNGDPVTTLTWTTTGGTLTNLCNNSESGQTLNIPANCNVAFSGGPAGTVISVSASPAELGGICKRSYTIAPPQGKPYCESLSLTPNYLTLNGQTNYTATASFRDANQNPVTYNIQMNWNGTNGYFSQNSSQNGPSSQSFNNTFNSTNDQYGQVVVSATVPSQNDIDLTNCHKEVSTQYTPPPQGNQCRNFRINWNNNQCQDTLCITNVDNYNGPFTWNINGNIVTNYDKCAYNARCSDTVTVYATNDQANCNANYQATPGKKYPPSLEKQVRSGRSGGYTNSTLTVQSNAQSTDVRDSVVNFQLIFTPNTNNTTATITDPALTQPGGIEAIPLPANAGSPDSKYHVGHITYDNSLAVTGGNISTCPPLNPKGQYKTEDDYTNCWIGDLIDGIRLYKVSNQITITYRGRLQSGITNEACEAGIVCQEKYKNTARADQIIVWGDDNNRDTYRYIDSNPVWIQIFCKYILSRAAGDIFLETDLRNGVDISQCSKYKSGTGVIITPGPTEEQKLISTGAGATIFTISHEICSEGQTGFATSAGAKAELGQYYGKDISKTLSSQICEIKLRPGEQWQSSAIVNSIEENKTRISRWSALSAPQYLSSLEGISTDSAEKVYHIKGTQGLTVDTDPKLLGSNGLKGAHTFIVEDGDLIIKRNITYPDSSLTDSVTDTPSYAFIVLNGNIYIDPKVDTLSGVFFVQKGNRADTGYLYSGSQNQKDVVSNTQLTIYGSVYGDIQPLFNKRIYSGDPALNEASINIRFDQRVILNTPPGLRDILSVTESQVAR